MFEPRSAHINKLLSDKAVDILGIHNDIWIGVVSHNGKSGPWKFATSGDNVIETMWDSDDGQPNDPGNELWAYIFVGGVEKKWYDYSNIYAKLNFICEYII